MEKVSLFAPFLMGMEVPAAALPMRTPIRCRDRDDCGMAMSHSAIIKENYHQCNDLNDKE
jgi:hypothetical protein